MFGCVEDNGICYYRSRSVSATGGVNTLPSTMGRLVDLQASSFNSLMYVSTAPFIGMIAARVETREGYPA